MVLTRWKMQSILRSEGGAEMDPRDHKKFKDVHASSELVRPEQAGHVIASLVVSASKALSGNFINWASDECKDHRGE
jgi:hypothetical protein